jgi:hypothetical protein
MRLVPIAAAALATLVALPSCGKQLSRSLAPNRPPEVRLESVHAASSGGASTFSLRWSGFDPDGRIDHYVYAVDPESVDRVDAGWIRTTGSSLELRFPAYHARGEVLAREPHVFAIRAVDDRGEMSSVVTTAAVEGNQPPIVTITHPRPSALYSPTVPPTIRIHWQGLDPDPVLTPKPVKYKWTLLSSGSEFPISLAIQDPDSLRRYYAPGFAGWDSTGKDSTAVTLTNLPEGAEYLFVVIAFDELGDYSPVFSLNSNLLRFRVGFAGTYGPLLTFPGAPTVGPGLDNPPLLIEVPENQRLSLGWSGQPPLGADMAGYRWVVDPVDVSDTTPRTDPSDIHHWTAVSLTETSVSLGPFNAPQVVRLYVDALDTFGWVTRALVELTVVGPWPMTQNLLIVDDTRLRPDQRDPATGCVGPPLGPWPTAAELDSFLYARGGYPWRCYPAGTTSLPGLFAGYDFDTIGTRGRTSMPFTILSRYRHVIWIVDPQGATYTNPVDSPSNPSTLLRWMTTHGPNTLAQYASFGGQVWLLGGGAAYADLISRNRTANDVPTVTFSNDFLELVPGTTMYDLAGWRSELRVAVAQGQILRYGGRFRESPVIAGLPEQLDYKSPATDPLPPLRTASAFYRTVANFEFLQQPNVVIEGGVSTLDTLFKARGAGLPFESGSDDHINPQRNVVMTRYHGPVIPQGFHFTGFDLWTFKRAQCRQLVDWVLREQWGLAPTTTTLTGGPAPQRPGGGGPVSRIDE